MSSAKWQPFCLNLNVIIGTLWELWNEIKEKYIAPENQALIK